MLLIIDLYFYIHRITHRQGWKLFRLEDYIQTRYKLKLHIIACYIKTSTNQFGNQHMLDGIANSVILRVLSNHYPTVCGRILWIILIVGQRLPSLPSLSHSGRFCEASTQSVSMWPICLVLKLQKFCQVFADTYNETFICKISLFVNSPKHINFKVTVNLV